MVDSILLDWQNYNQSFILTELHHWRSLNNLRVVSCVISDKIISATIQSFVFDTISVSRKSFHNWFLKGSQDASWKHQPRNFKTLNQTNDIWCRFTSQDHLNGHVNKKKKISGTNWMRKRTQLSIRFLKTILELGEEN